MKYLVNFVECHGDEQAEFEVEASGPVQALAEACGLLMEEGENPLMYSAMVNVVEYPLVEGVAETPEGCPSWVAVEFGAV